MKKYQRDHLINIYLNRIDSPDQAIRQTITSVWSATVLYILIYGSAISFSLNYEINISWWIILILSGILTYLFAIFIFAQFSGWINKRTYSLEHSQLRQKSLEQKYKKRGHPTAQE